MRGSMSSPIHTRHDQGAFREAWRILRRHRVLIVLAVVIATAAGAAYSLLRDPVYLASASLEFQDEGQDLDLLGAVVPPEQQPDKVAAANVGTVTKSEVRRQSVQELQDLGTQITLPELDDTISAQVASSSNLVLVEARSGDPAEARRIANTVAGVAADVQNEATRTRFADAADSLRAQSKSSKDPSTEALYKERVARFVALSKIARPVRLVDEANAPDSPVSPRPLRDTLLAIFLGLVLGVIGAFARESFDRRLHSTDEIQEQMKLPVIGYVREKAMGQAPSTGNGHKPIEERDLDAFRILRANLAFLDVDNPPRSVLVTSALPEEGKSTVAASLAHASAMAGVRTLLVECDLRRPVLSARLGIDPQPGLTDYLVGETSEVIREVPIGIGSTTTNGSGGAMVEPALALSCIPAGTITPQPAEMLGSERFQRFVTDMAEAHDLVVIDAPPLLSVVDTLEIVPLVDAVIVCVRVSKTTRDQMGAAKAALDHLSPRPTGVVITGMRPRDEPDYGYYSYNY